MCARPSNSMWCSLFGHVLPVLSGGPPQTGSVTVEVSGVRVMNSWDLWRGQINVIGTGAVVFSSLMAGSGVSAIAMQFGSAVSVSGRVTIDDSQTINLLSAIRVTAGTNLTVLNLVAAPAVGATLRQSNSDGVSIDADAALILEGVTLPRSGAVSGPGVVWLKRAFIDQYVTFNQSVPPILCTYSVAARNVRSVMVFSAAYGCG